MHHDRFKPFKGEQSLQWANSAFKAYKPKTKLGPPTQRTQENECNLVNQSSVTYTSAMFSCSIVRRLCPSPPTGGIQVSWCNPLSQSSVTHQSCILKNAKFRQVSLRVSSCVPCRVAYKCDKCDYTIKQYHEMCTHVLMAHFDEKMSHSSAEFLVPARWLMVLQVNMTILRLYAVAFYSSDHWWNWSRSKLWCPLKRRGKC